MQNNGYELVEGKRYRSGWTTGTCAAIAARGATWMLVHQKPTEEASVLLPGGEIVTLSLQNPMWSQQEASAQVIKDAGDDPDVTHGMTICARVIWSSQPGIQILGGPGVGRVTKRGLAVPAGEAAINPIPQKMIRNAVEPLLEDTQGVIVEISVPDGEEIARKTFNPRLGIMGGISILGTTGMVRPMSEEAYRISLGLHVRQWASEGHRLGVLVPGNHGEKMALQQYGVSPTSVFHTSNFIGYMLDTCVDCGIERVLLIGHIGKLIKVAAGIFHTANRVADARQEIMASYLARFGADQTLIEEIFEMTTMDAVVERLAETDWNRVFPWIADRVTRRCEEHVADRLQVGVTIYSLNGTILAESGRVQEWQEEGCLECWR